MNVVVSLPDAVAHELGTSEQELERKMLEALALEGYRSETLTAFQVGEMLGLKTRMQVDGFFKKNGIFIEYTQQEMDEQRKILRELFKKR